MKTKTILVINAGSSSIKFSLFSNTPELALIYDGEIENMLGTPYFTILDAKHMPVVKEKLNVSGFKPVLETFLAWLENNLSAFSLQAVGHRVVHGGKIFLEPAIINNLMIEKITPLIPLAPLHLPYNLEAIKIIAERFPSLPQVACFDTAFHQTQNHLATLFAIPRSFTEEGIIRYGFHGLSYEYIASVLPKYLGDKADAKVIVAHLGAGASMCAMHYRKSVATSMGFTALEGLIMESRCGSIDPGVLLYFLQEKKFTAEKMSHMLYHESGLLGVSGISADVRELIASDDPKAKEAIDLFCYRAALELGSLCAALEGCDAIVFTAGIGENSAVIRNKICGRSEWLGVVLDEKANLNNSHIISRETSKIQVCVIPTNEESMIAKHTYRLCS